MSKKSLSKTKQLLKKGGNEMKLISKRDKMKTIIRISSLIMILVMIVTMGIIPSAITKAGAVGDANIGGANNGTKYQGNGSGKKTNFWPSGSPDGVRITIYKDGKRVGKTVDFTNVTGLGNVRHFGKKSKKDYLDNKTSVLMPDMGKYTYVNTTGSAKLPPIVGGDMEGKIKPHFIKEAVVKKIASETGVNYNTMVNDSSYQMMLEPIIYVVYRGYSYAMTATEAAIWNTQVKDDMYTGDGYWLSNVVFGDLPISMWLKKTQWNIKGYSSKPKGNRGSGRNFTDSTIKARLGVGAINFKDAGLGSKVETQVVAMANNPIWNEGDKAKIGVVFMNNGSSTRVFPITIWVGDGINKGKAEAYKIETSIRIGAGQTYIYHIPTTVTMQPWITTVTARINWGDRSKETNPNNNEKTFALTVKKKDTVETKAEIIDVRVYRDGKWQYLSDLPASQRILNEGERISPRVKFTNTSTSQTKFQAEVWVGDGLGTGPLVEHLIWENGQAYNPSRPSNNRPTAPPLYSIGAGRAITTNVQAGTIGYPVKATDTDITARINYPNRAQETNPNNNKAVRKIQVRPRNQTVETSVESVKAYNQHGKEVTEFVSGQTYTIKATYKNDSSDQTSFPVRLAFGATVPPGSGTAVSGSGTKTIAKGGGKYVLTTTYKATGTSTLHWQASINWDNRMIETNTNNNFTAGTFKTVASASVIETDTWIDAVEVFRPNKSGTGRIPVRLENLEKQGYEPLTEGDELMIRVFYRNRSTSRTNFFANLYIGDGLGYGPLTEYKLWQNGQTLKGEGGPSSWTISNNGIPTTVILYYNVKATDTTITSRINYSGRNEEENPNDNEDIYEFKVKSKTETGVTIPKVEVKRDGKWQVLDKNDPVVYVGEEIRPHVRYNNAGTKGTAFHTEVWVGDGWGTAPLIEQLIWENNKSYYPTPHPSNNRPTSPALFPLKNGEQKTVVPTGYIVKASDKEITALINYSNRNAETEPRNNKAIYEIEVLPREAIAETSVEEVVLLDITGVSDEEFEANWQVYYDDVKEHGWRSDYYIGEGGQRMKAGQRVALIAQFANNSSKNYSNESFSSNYLLNGEDWNQEGEDYTVTIPRGKSVCAIELFTVTNSMINAANPTLGNSLEFEVRVNWENRQSELNPNNNSGKASSGVVPDNLSIDPLEPNAYYTENTEVMTTFVVNNDFSTNITPSDGLNALITPYYLDSDGDRVDIDSITIENIIIPSKGTNIIYTKWNVPAYDMLSDGQVYVECKLNPDGTITEEDYEDNVTVISNDVVTREHAETPDPVFRLKLPRTFGEWNLNMSSSENRRYALAGVAGEDKVRELKNSYTWEEWVWKDNGFKKEEYEVGVNVKTDHETGAHLYPGIRARAAQTYETYTHLDTFEMTSGSAVSLVYVPQYIRSENSREEQITKVQNVYTVFPEFGTTYYAKDRQLAGGWYGVEYSEEESGLFYDEEHKPYRTLEKVSYEDYLKEKEYQQYFPGDNRYMNRKFEFASEGDDIWMFAPLSYGTNPEDVGLPEDFKMRQHYTPLWFPNNYEYVVGVVPVDVWTPVGMATAPQASSPVSIWKTIYDEFSIPTWNANNRPSDSRLKDLMYGHRRYYKYWKSDVDDSYGDGWNHEHKLWDLLREN